VSLDYMNEADAVQKIRIAAKCSPLLTAMFANSCITEGRLNGYKSVRSYIWQQTDPDRCGLPECFFDDGFSLADYVEYALDVPIFFIIRDGRTLGPLNMTFRQFMQQGFRGHEATLDDWRLQLTCLFPEIRVRNYIELRSCDRQAGKMAMAIPTLIKLLFYDTQALSSLQNLLRDLSRQDCINGLAEAAKQGLEGRLAKYRLLDLAREVMALAKESLGRLLKEGRSSAFEQEVFEELEEMICEDGACPADRAIKEVESGKTVFDIVRRNCL